ncbi:MAG: class I SAM-dependent methyltransferase [Acidobacteria bacterium]|nr:class I SAM-dependent methyltransferase [Acidobacteriota bacterium]
MTPAPPLRESTVPLKDTFESSETHQRWESVYRTHPLLDRLNDQILERLLEIMRPAPGALLLDAGCGVGSHLMRFARRGFQCTGVDISQIVLKQAAENVARSRLGAYVKLSCEALEKLSFADASFDLVHCRGVLMHIPDWKRALGELLRVLKPGGRIALLEANHRAVEARLVRLARRFRQSQSRMQPTADGVEFWSEEGGHPFVHRVANQRVLRQELESRGVRPLGSFAAEFWDVNFFPAGLGRNAAIRFNQLWFALHGPAWLGSGVAIVGEKLSTAPKASAARTA